MWRPMRRISEPLLPAPEGGILYVQLYRQMRQLILEGCWPAGMRIPSSRTLASDLGISRNTATMALEQLLAEGWIETRSRSGTFVSASLPPRSRGFSRLGPEAPAAKPTAPFTLANGASDIFPFDRWAKLQSRAWAGSVQQLLDEPDPAGDAGLRQAIARIVAPSR
jgi:GntR family transcriptional regulator / MocR family aminotransferase